MMITVEPSPALYLALKKRLEEMGKGDRAKEVLQKAIKEMAHSTKLRLHSETKAIYTIKRSAFKQSDIRVKNPTKNRLYAMIAVEGEPIPLKVGYSSRKNAKRKAASAKVRADGSMKELTLESGGRRYKAFVATMTNVSKSGKISEHAGIFQRVPGEFNRPGREKIKQIYAPARSLAAKKAYQEKIASDMQGELSYRLHKHMNTVIYGRR